MDLSFKSIDQIEVTSELSEIYSALISELKERECTVNADALLEFQKRASSELLLFMYLGDRIIGMAQLSLSFSPTRSVGYVNNVVVGSEYRGGGRGTLLMEALERTAKERWNFLSRIMLTSNPARGTQGFYVKLGYAMRTKEAGDETIVYVKDV